MTQLAQKLEEAGIPINPETEAFLKKRFENKTRRCLEGTVYRTHRSLGNVSCSLNEIFDFLRKEIVVIDQTGPARVGYKQMPQGKLNVMVYGNDIVFLRKIRAHYELRARATITLKVITREGESRPFYNLDLKTLPAKAKVQKKLVVSNTKKPKGAFGCDNPYQGGSIYIE